MSKTTLTPDWSNQPPETGSYRSIFKFGRPDEFKHPRNQLVEIMKTEFGMTDDDFRHRRDEGKERVTLGVKPGLSDDHINSLGEIVGAENISTTDYDRAKYSSGQSLKEVLDLRHNSPSHVTDAVLHPRDKHDVRKIVEYCNTHKIPVCVYSGGSSVVMGITPEKGGVILVMSTHMNKLLKINDINQTATVQPGMMGPDYEDALNNAPERFKAARRYTCGHFPQSFEMSSVGGWVVTLGSGQASSYYGDAYHIVLSQEYVTPAGSFKTHEYPATATGPKLNDIMKGSEGAFGILVELTMKIFRYMPENRRYFAFMFPTWESAVDASREISQSEFGMPAVYRISDPEETDRGLKLYGFDTNALFEKFMSLWGMKPLQRCICMGTAEGEEGFTRLVGKRIKSICKKHGALTLPSAVCRTWEKTRYKEPLMREDFMDFGIITDTLESAVTWDNLLNLHREVRAFIKKRPGTICMTHASHFYPNGTNLYFIFVLKPKTPNEYYEFHSDIVSAIVKNGGSVSHHHGVGKLLSPWMETHLGKEQMDVLRALKKHFDPNNIMNPGAQLALNKPQD